MSEVPERRRGSPAGARSVSLALGIAALAVALLALIVVARPRHSGPPPSVAPSAGEATVTADAAEVRTEAWGRGTTVEALPRGARVKVLADRGRWLEVRTAKGSKGFLPSEFVETDAEKDAREKRTKRILSFPPVYGVVAEDTDILLAPFPLAPREGRLSKGSSISIHAVDHAFYAFRTPQGGIAFVNSSDVDLLPPDPRRPAIVPEGSRAVKDLKLTDLPRPDTTPLPEGATQFEPAEPPETSGASRPEELAPATLLAKVDPVYPESARRAGVEGTVVLDATISADGRVTDVQVVRGLPLGLSESAVEAVQRWQYRPARGRAGPIASHKTVRIVFTLGD